MVVLTVFIAGLMVGRTPEYLGKRIQAREVQMAIRHAGKVLTHRQLLKDVWGVHYAGQSHYARVYMAQLRQKLEEDPSRPRLLITEPGVGYRLRAE
jgi:two-component system KDP operon response regulator KdpE